MAAFLSVSSETAVGLKECCRSGHVRVTGTLRGLLRVSPLLSLRLSLRVSLLVSFCSHRKGELATPTVNPCLVPSGDSVCSLLEFCVSVHSAQPGSSVDTAPASVYGAFTRHHPFFT